MFYQASRRGQRCEAEQQTALGPKYDRIVSMASVRPVPESWLKSLRPGGCLVTVIARTGLIITADAGDSGEWAAKGRIEWDRAWFMSARLGVRDGTSYVSVRNEVDTKTGGKTTKSEYPVINVRDSWELSSLPEIDAPGTEHDFDKAGNGQRTAPLNSRSREHTR